MIVRLFTSAALAALVVCGAGGAHAQDAQQFTPKQVEAIEKIVQDYLLTHPEIIPQAISALQEKERMAQETEAQRYLNDKGGEIFKDPAAPVLGNPDGDVNVVEFVDYNCGYCKAVHAAVKDAVKADGKVRLIYKELPILGETSVVAARAALAANMQKKYAEFQEALIKNRGPLSEDAIMKIAEQTGLDMEKLKADMASPDVEAALQKNQIQARNLAIRGTPSFIVGSRVIYGAVDKGTLKQLIDQSRTPMERERALMREKN